MDLETGQVVGIRVSDSEVFNPLLHWYVKPNKKSPQEEDDTLTVCDITIPRMMMCIIIIMTCENGALTSPARGTVGLNERTGDHSCVGGESGR